MCEKVTQAVQPRADDRLRECAIQREDEWIIAITSRDIVAAEARYHASCYKLHTAKTRDSECSNENEKRPYYNQKKGKTEMGCTCLPKVPINHIIFSSSKLGVLNQAA